MSKKYNNRIYSTKTITGGLFALALSVGIIYGAYILFNELIVPIASDISSGISSGVKYLATNENLSKITNKTNGTNENLSKITNKTNGTNENLGKITNKTNGTNENLSKITNKTNGTNENTPGFGIVVSLVGLFTIALMIKRHNKRL